MGWRKNKNKKEQDFVSETPVTITNRPISDPSGDPPGSESLKVEYRKKVNEYLEAKKALMIASENVWMARHLGDREMEERFGQEIKNVREEYLETREKVGLNKPAQLKIVYDNESVRVEGTPKDWLVANYHLKKLNRKYDCPEQNEELDTTVFDSPEYIIPIGFEEPYETYALRSNKSRVYSDAYILARRNVIVLAGGEETKWLLEGFVRDYEKSDGEQFYKVSASTRARSEECKRLGRLESVRALEKHVLNNPKYEGKIKFTTEWKGGLKG